MSSLTRRQTLGLAGAAGAGLVLGRGAPDTPSAQAQTPACTLSPAMTEGPYFVDERINRSDIRDGQSGVLLTLDIVCVNTNNNCAPYPGAVVDMWHAAANGTYSDIASEGTSGQKWLRGYQVTDANGVARFVTIFPGWYSGRTVHIHLKVRTFDGSSTTFEFTTQLYFDQSQTNAIVATYGRGTPDRTNANDGIYSASTQIALSGSTAAGYTGSLTLGLAGLTGTSGSTPTTADKAVAAALTKASWTRTKRGTRYLKLRLDVDEAIAAVDARVLRGSRTLARTYSKKGLKTGTRTVSVRIPAKVVGGAARLKLTLRDGAGNRKVIRRKVRVRKRSR